MSKTSHVASAPLASLPIAPALPPAPTAAAVTPARPAAPADGFKLRPAGDFSKAKQALVDGVLRQAGPHARLSRPEVEKLTFAELAHEDVPGLFDQALRALQYVGADTSPDDVKIRGVRKSIERLRNHLDLFASVYPLDGEHGWGQLRKQVDAVYEALGQLKDLHDSGLALSASLGWSDVPSDLTGAAAKLHDEVMPQRRQRLVDACATFEANAPAFRAMLASPLEAPTQLEKHDAKDSRFYWGGVKANPKPTETGLQSIRRLLEKQAGLARTNSKNVTALDSPFGKKSEREFHDLRKRVRSLINVAAYFPEVFAEPAHGADLQRKLYSLVLEFGDVEDRLVRLHTAAELGDLEDRATAETEVLNLWPHLMRWQREQQIEGLLQDFADALGPA
ncbi:MAG: CHAD domain-containing protein [Archangiaceae bacterium]|nr:CHAD domain-containing protein [Archangiaceae bacterium]